MRFFLPSFQSFLVCPTLGVLAVLTASLAGKPGPFQISPPAADLLSTYCSDCHGDGQSKGEISLDDLPALSLEGRLDLLNKVQEQLHFGEMPPADEFQPPRCGSPKIQQLES